MTIRNWWYVTISVLTYKNDNFIWFSLLESPRFLAPAYVLAKPTACFCPAHTPLFLSSVPLSKPVPHLDTHILLGCRCHHLQEHSLSSVPQSRWAAPPQCFPTTVCMSVPMLGSVSPTSLWTCLGQGLCYLMNPSSLCLDTEPSIKLLVTKWVREWTSTKKEGLTLPGGPEEASERVHLT